MFYFLGWFLCFAVLCPRTWSCCCLGYPELSCDYRVGPWAVVLSSKFQPSSVMLQIQFGCCCIFSEFLTSGCTISATHVTMTTTPCDLRISCDKGCHGVYSHGFDCHSIFLFCSLTSVGKCITQHGSIDCSIGYLIDQPITWLTNQSVGCYVCLLQWLVS